MNLQLMRGRAFSDSDATTGHEAAIVNQRFATAMLASTAVQFVAVALAACLWPARGPRLDSVHALRGV